MKLSLHSKRILLFLPCQGKDALSKFSLKENLDETVTNYNYNCIKKQIKYIKNISLEKSKILLKKKKDRIKSFTIKFFKV